MHIATILDSFCWYLISFDIFWFEACGHRGTGIDHIRRGECIFDIQKGSAFNLSGQCFIFTVHRGLQFFARVFCDVSTWRSRRSRIFLFWHAFCFYSSFNDICFPIFHFGRPAVAKVAFSPFFIWVFCFLSHIHRHFFPKLHFFLPYGSCRSAEKSTCDGCRSAWRVCNFFFQISISWYQKFKNLKHADELTEKRNSLTAEWIGPKEEFVEKHAPGKVKRTSFQKLQQGSKPWRGWSKRLRTSLRRGGGWHREILL